MDKSIPKQDFIADGVPADKVDAFTDQVVKAYNQTKKKNGKA